MHILFVLLVLAFAGEAAIAQETKPNFTVVDGKTIVIDGKQRRIKGYDAPILKRPHCEDEPQGPIS